MPNDNFPRADRVVEIIQVLMEPSNRVIRRLRQSKLLEKVPLIVLYCEDWPDFSKKYRYQPRSVAFAIARAEAYKNTYLNILSEKKAAQTRKKDSIKAVETNIKKIERCVGNAFWNLPSDIRLSSLYKPEELYMFHRRNLHDYAGYRALENKLKAPSNIRKYCSATRDSEYATERLKRLSGSTTKPFEKPMNDFCRDMEDLFRHRKLPPNYYALIADIANLFQISKKYQTYNSIAKRFSRLRSRRSQRLPKTKT